MLNLAHNQVSIFDLYTDIDELTDTSNFNLFKLFDSYINIFDMIPQSFYKAYYSNSGTNRDFPLEGMIKALIFYDLLGLPTINTLIFIINISSDFRRFLKFPRAPHKSQFSRFKSSYYSEIYKMFHHLVDLTDEIATATDEFLASILISDTTGFEFYVKENNPKFYQSMLKTAKTYAKTHSENITFDIEKYAQSKMPKFSFSNHDAKLTYLNGHFGYYLKVILSTNGFGLVRDINFYNTDNSLETDLTPQETKDSFDAKSLIPSLETLFAFHPYLYFKYFLGDSGFDAAENYAYLYERGITPIISLNPRNKSSLPSTLFTDEGIPLCPNNGNLPMVYTGIIKSESRADRIQYICPKRSTQMIDGKKYIIQECDNPCTPSLYGRTKNLTVHHNYRYNSAMPRSSDEWINLYKLRTVCERTIAQLKAFIQINISRIHKTLTLKSNILLAGITQLISFLLLFRSKNTLGPLAIKTLIA